MQVSFAIDLELDGEGNGWTSVDDDVLMVVPRSLDYGIDGSLPTDRVAKTGTASFALDNSESNSEGIRGLYTPGGVNALAGFQLGIGVRISIVYGSNPPRPKWQGVIDAVEPLPGIYGLRQTIVHCVDYMDEAARANTRNIPVQTNKRSDQLFSLLLAAIVRQPPATEIGFGMEEYSHAFDNSRDEGLAILTEWSRLADSELGYIYIKSSETQAGIMTFEDRRRRGVVSDPVASFNGFHALSAVQSRNAITNRVQVKTHPRYVDADLVPIFRLDKALEIPVGTSQTFRAPFTDQSQRRSRIGAIYKEQPVAGTDFEFNTLEDGTGSVISGQLTVTLGAGGNTVDVTVTNNGPYDGFLLEGFQIRGLGVYDEGEVILTAEDAASQAEFGENLLTVDMPYQSDLKVAQNAAYYLLSLSKSQTSVEEISFIANSSHELMQQAIAREISDRIRITDEMTGIDTDFFINGISLDIDSEGVLRCTWIVTPADTQQYLILDHATLGQLDEEKLAYGLWNRYWIYGTSVLDTDTNLNP